MNNYFSKDILIYLIEEVGLDETSIELGLKLSMKNNSKGEKFTRDLKKNYLEFDGLFDELFILIQEFIQL